MKCQTCGRPAENGVPTHWLGCTEAPSFDFRDQTRAFVAKTLDNLGVLCEHDECSQPKRPPGKGPRPKYCTDHSDPKNRK